VNGLKQIGRALGFVLVVILINVHYRFVVVVSFSNVDAALILHLDLIELNVWLFKKKMMITCLVQLLLLKRSLCQSPVRSIIY